MSGTCPLQAIKLVTGKAGEQEGEQEGAEVAGEVQGEAAGLVAEGAKALTCAFCGARNPLYFHYCFNCGLRLDQEKQEGEGGDEPPPDSLQTSVQQEH